MQSFTLDWRRWRIARVVGRNVLLRGSDRIETLLVLVACAVSLLSVAVGGAVGTSVYEVSGRFYAAQAEARHPVDAAVVRASSTMDENPGATVNVQATWQVGDVARTGSFEWDGAVKAGDRVTIWVNEDGNRVGRPTPTSQAGFDGVVAGLSIVLLVAGAMTLVVVAGRWTLDRGRYKQWDRELRCFVDDGGGRPNRHQ